MHPDIDSPLIGRTPETQVMSKWLNVAIVAALAGPTALPASRLADPLLKRDITPEEKHDAFCEVLSHSNDISPAPLLDITTEAGFMANWTLYVLLVLDEAACDADRSEQIKQTFERIDKHWTIMPSSAFVAVTMSSRRRALEPSPASSRVAIPNPYSHREPWQGRS